MIKTKIIKRSKNSSSSAPGDVIGFANSSMQNLGHAKEADHAKEAEHAAKADIATYAETAGQANHALSADEAQHAKEADHADMAHDLDPDSPVRDEFLSKVKSDRTPYSLAVGGELIAEGNARSRDYAEGLTGFGWLIDMLGNIYGDSLTLRRFLEVPELRFNRAEVIHGVQWHAPGGGIVESCDGTGITLKLETGEIGAVKAGDLCMGIWHFPKASETEEHPYNLVRDSISRTVPNTPGKYNNVGYVFDKPMSFRKGDRFCVSIEGIENIEGNPAGYSAYIFDMGTGDGHEPRSISRSVDFDAQTKTCVLEIINDTDCEEVRLLLYDGLNGQTAGNSVRYSKVMLVRGDTPAKWNYAESEAEALAANNADADYDDRKGTFRFAGFTTMYFEIVAVDGADNRHATIRMRDGYGGLMPQPGMHFVAFGNRTDTERQTCRYATRTYERMMKGVDDWEFRPGHIMMQTGDLTGLKVADTDMSGYSAYLNNVYFSGIIRQIDDSRPVLTLDSWGDAYVGAGRKCVIVPRVIKGFEDITAQCTWQVVYDSGVSGDNYDKGTESFEFTDSILNGHEQVTVTVTAAYTDAAPGRTYTAVAHVVIRDYASLRGTDGTYAPNLLVDTRTKPVTFSQAHAGDFTIKSTMAADGFVQTEITHNVTNVWSWIYADIASQLVDGAENTLVFGRRYTVSMDYRSDCRVLMDMFGPSAAGSSEVNRHFFSFESFPATDGEWRRASVSFVFTEDWRKNQSYINFGLFPANDAPVGAKTTIRKLCLTEGESTAWAPALSEMKGSDGDKGEDAQSVEWGINPSVIHCDATGVPTIGSLSVQAWHVIGAARQQVNRSGTLSEWSAQYRCTTDSGQTQWKALTVETLTIDRTEMDARPRFDFRVLDKQGNVISQTSVGYVCDGAQGKKGDTVTGPEGPVVRIRGPFQNGEYYYDGTVPDPSANNTKWLDVVWVNNAAGTDRQYSRCTKHGFYYDSTGPKYATPQSSVAGWQPFSYISALLADIIVAENARIKFLNGQEIVFGEENADGTYTVWGRIGSPTKGTGGVTAQSDEAEPAENAETASGTGGMTTMTLADIIMWLGGGTAESSTHVLDKHGRARYGKASGQRIEIDPTTEEMRVFDPQNRQVVTIDGKAHDIDAAYGCNDSLKRNWSGVSYGTAGTNTVKLGTLTVGKAGATINGWLDVYAVTPTLYYKPLKLSEAEKQVYSEVSVKFGIRRVGSTAFYDYTDRTYRGERRNGADVPNTGVNTFEDSTSEILSFLTNLTEGTYEVVAQTMLSESEMITNGGTAKPSARLSKFGGLFTAGNEPKAFVGQNGLLSANSTSECFTAGVRDVDGEKMFTIDLCAGTFGLRVCRNGIYGRRNGQWELLELPFKS